MKAYKTSDTKRFFLYNLFDHPDWQNVDHRLPPCESFYIKLRSWEPLATEQKDFGNLLKIRITTEQAVIKLKLSKPLPTWSENYEYLPKKWKQEQVSSFKDFVRWCNQKNVVPILKAMQKMIVFNQDQHIYRLKLGCTLPKMANYYTNLQIQIFNPSRRHIKTFCRKRQNVMLVVLLPFLHAKQVLMNFLFGSLPTYASQLLGLMLANYIHLRCVNLWTLVFYALELQSRDK